MSKLLKFQVLNEFFDLVIKEPEPASKHLPKWYLNTNQFEKSKKTNSDDTVGTYKMCAPFVDTLISGYMITSSADIIVKNIGEEVYTPFIDWRCKWDPVDVKDPGAIVNYPVPNGCNKTFYRWNNFWKITTPKGYSLLVTHPINRSDLPFVTLTAIIDSDKHPNSLWFPFFIREGFEGVIPKGTPIVQVIPIKRDNWKLEKVEYSEKDTFYAKNILSTNITRAYKKMFWSRKKYE